MNVSPHLLVYISAHGFGHVAQTAPILNALFERLPDLRLTLRTAAPLSLLEARISPEFQLSPQATDFGMVMASAMDVMVEASMQAYSAFHQTWSLRVEQEARTITCFAPDFVLSNIAYLPLAAAKQVGIPCAAMCSLNWADIFDRYCGALPEAAQIHGQMLQAYAAADMFLRLTPGMPMESLSNLRLIGPVARIGQNRRSEINARLGLGKGERLVLITLGGIATRLPMECWRRLPGVRWLVQADWGVAHPDIFPIESLDMDFTDVLASCDALLCKPGYGSFTEAACNGLPVLYIGRPDWPEQPCLVNWLTDHGNCLEIGRVELEQGNIGNALDQLLAQPKPVPVVPGGIAEVVDYLLGSLSRRSISIASP